MSVKEFESYPMLPYWTRVRTPLFEILKTLENRIDRDLRAELLARCGGTPIWLLTNIRVARVTWEVIEALARDRKDLALGLEIGASIPPLARVLCEAFFTIVFTFEDLSARLPWFWKATWRGMTERLADYQRSYGNDPTWTEWLADYEREVDAWRDTLVATGMALTPVELTDPSEIAYWPNPGGMKRASQDPERKGVIGYFQARYYGRLSAASHLSGTGLLAQNSAVDDDRNENIQRKYFSDQVLTGLTLLFGFVTQVCLDVVRDPHLAKRIVGLWQTPNLWPAATEAYDRCFKTGLEALAAA